MKIGLCLSRCGGLISEAIYLPYLADEYGELAMVMVYDDIFAAQEMEALWADVSASGVEAVVLAGDSPRRFEYTRKGMLLVERLEEMGINFNKIAFANLKEQVALPHRGQKEEATKKAKLLIDVALAKVECSTQGEVVEVAPHRSILVLGTTLGGLVAAQGFLERGYHVYLVDRASRLKDFSPWQEEMQALLSAVQLHPNASFSLGSTILDFWGWCGDYSVKVVNDQGVQSIAVGGVIVALGDDEEWTDQLRLFLHIDVDAEGFFAVKDSRTLPVQTIDEGICVIPRYHGPDGLSYQVTRGDLAVLALAQVLDRPQIRHEVRVSKVDESLCGACGTCVKTCPFKACTIDALRKVSVVDPRRCKGCGNCVVACPTGARDLAAFPNDYFLRAIDILGQYKPPEGAMVLLLLCEGCGYAGLDFVGMTGFTYPTSILPLAVPCGGRIDTQYLLEAYHKGFDGVLICRCEDGHCRNIVGNVDLERRANLVREVLRSRGIDAERLQIFSVARCESSSCAQTAAQFAEELKKVKELSKEGKAKWAVG